MKTLAICAFALMAVCAPAAGAEPTDLSSVPLTTLQMRAALDRQAHVADLEMANALSQLSSEADPASRAQLDRSQAAWRTLRAQQCDFEGDRYQGGTLQPVVALECYVRVTQDRAKELGFLAISWANP